MSRRHTERSRRAMHRLAEELAIGAAIRLHVESDSIRPVVDAVVAYMVEEYPSQDIYIPRPPPPAPADLATLRADVANMSMRALCRKYHCDRRTIYRLLDRAPA